MSSGEDGACHGDRACQLVEVEPFTGMEPVNLWGWSLSSCGGGACHLVGIEPVILWEWSLLSSGDGESQLVGVEFVIL
jgi:hypothetical protein